MEPFRRTLFFLYVLMCVSNVWAMQEEPMYSVGACYSSQLDARPLLRQIAMQRVVKGREPTVRFAEMASVAIHAVPTDSPDLPVITETAGDYSHERFEPISAEELRDWDENFKDCIREVLRQPCQLLGRSCPHCRLSSGVEY